jgi:lipopolysaccharide transport system permease protein
LPLQLRSLWDYRDLLYFLVSRDIKVRYRQTFLGISWAVLQPLLMTLAFFVFFRRLVGVPSEGVPYPVFAFCGLLAWQLFAFALVESSNCLVVNERLITKVYFPRLIIPVASVLVGLVDFVFGFLVLLGMMLWWRLTPAATIWALPLLVIWTLAAALSVGLWLAALNVKYRDVRYTIPFITQLGLFMSPVVYPASLVPDPWRKLYSLNPMVGGIEGMRWAVFGGGEGLGVEVGISLIAVGFSLVGGSYYFRRVERSFADVI